MEKVQREKERMHDGKRRRMDSYMQRNKREKCKGETREGKRRREEMFKEESVYTNYTA